MMFFLAMDAVAQSSASEYVQTGISAYDVPADARSVALAESFVALTGNYNALMYNPAGLGAIRGVRFSYLSRKFDWTSFLDDAKYYAVAGTVQTPFVNVGFIYNRFNLGEVFFSTPENPRGIGKGEVYNYALGVGLGKRVSDHWDIGIGFKTFDFGWNKVSGDIPTLTTSRPFLIDAGFIYSNQITAEQQSFVQEYSIGFALQNVGGKIKSTTRYISGTTNTSESGLPQYLRFGFTYSLTIPGQNSESLQPFSMLVSGEYRTFTNGADFQSSQKDFWGLGIELKAIEIFSARFSAYINPYSSVYGKKGIPALRYGFGVSLPLQRLGSSLPIVVYLDYAGIPPQISNGFGDNDKIQTMHSFAASLQYVNELF